MTVYGTSRFRNLRAHCKQKLSLVTVAQVQIYLLYRLSGELVTQCWCAAVADAPAGALPRVDPPRLPSDCVSTWHIRSGNFRPRS